MDGSQHFSPQGRTAPLTSCPGRQAQASAASHGVSDPSLFSGAENGGAFQPFLAGVTTFQPQADQSGQVIRIVFDTAKAA